MANGNGWIQRIPKTELTWVFAWAIAFAVVGRSLWTGEAPDGTLLAFTSALIFAAAGLQVGMRATTKPEVIRAETEAKVVEQQLDPNEGEGRTTAVVDPRRGLDDEGHPI